MASYTTQQLNLEDKAINFERSNQITQKRISSWLDQGRLENQVELSNEIYQVGKYFLNWLTNIWQSNRIS